MSNIRGLGDYNSNPNNNNNNQGNFSGDNGQIPNFLRNFMQATRVNRDPRKESFLDFLKFTVCPTLHLRSFISIVTIMEIITYLICIIGSCVEYSGINKNIFLGVNQSLLDNFDKNPSQIKNNYQVWRLVTAVFLHTGFSHIVSNIVAQLIFGSILESMIGFTQIACVYLASGIGGNLFSSYINTSSSVGASTAINGVVTSLLAMIIINWHAMSGNQQLEQTRCILLAIVILMIVMNLMFFGSNSQGSVEKTDTLGHVGGALTGLFWGMAFFPRVKSVYAHKMRLAGLCLTSTFFILFGCLLFLNK